jgi:hypothetical protein
MEEGTGEEGKHDGGGLGISLAPTAQANTALYGYNSR